MRMLGIEPVAYYTVFLVDDFVLSVAESERAIIIKNSLISEPVKRIVHYLYGSFDYKDELIRGCLTELVALICQGECEYTNLQKNCNILLCPLGKGWHQIKNLRHLY